MKYYKLVLECGNRTIEFEKENAGMSNWFNGTIWCDNCFKRCRVIDTTEKDL
jgi:hypothetical protein